MPRILIIDDDRVSREFLRRILEPEGHDITEAPNGRMGVRVFREAPFDLVITDIFMPEGDGLETIRELRNEFPHVKIIAISAGSTKGFDMLDAATSFGALRTLTKPFDREVFVGAVKELLDE